MIDPRMNQADPRFNLLFILGLGRSGSTLFGRLLNQHPDVLNVGELLRFEEALDDPSSKCSCGLCTCDCPDWNGLFHGIPDKVKRYYKKWTPALLGKVRENAGAKVLVDVSKTRAYRLARRWRDPGVGFILLLRDPRGIFLSHVVENKDLIRRLKLHKKWITRYEAFARKNGHRCHLMHYEDLVTSPESEMRAACGFIGIDYRPEMISLAAESTHMATYSQSPYLKGSGELRLDERWRRDMKPEDIATISATLKSVAIYNKRYHLDGTA